jgi:hypothetical protein
MKRSLLMLVVFLVPAVTAIVFYCALTGHGFSGEIRLDTGDLRYCFLGIPYSSRRMPEPERSLLLSVARDSEILKPQWHTCVRYPLPTSNNSDLMCRRFYCHATAWISVDPALARLILEDIAKYVVETDARYSLPESCPMLTPPTVEWEDSGRARVPEDWRDSVGSEWYCEQKGYSPPGAPPIAEP